MRSLSFFILFFLIPLNGLAASPILTRINKIEQQDSIQLYFTFTAEPQYLINERNKRIDLVLEKIGVDGDFVLFEPDGKIVKILTQHKNNNTILSFYFRYKPQRIKVVPGKDPNKLVVDILPGNQFSSHLPDFASKLKGLTIVKRSTKDYSNPLIASPYADNWVSFFSRYESDVTIELPVQFSLPNFPIIALLRPDKGENITVMSEEIQQLAEEKLWQDMIPLLIEALEDASSLEKKKKLAFCHGEALARAGDFTGAYKQFFLLKKEYSEEEIGFLSHYMLIWLEAKFKDHYQADYDLKTLESWATGDNPLTPYFTLMQIETALATKQFEQMNRLLKTDFIAYPGESNRLREIRQADYWYATGQRIKAYVGYFQHEKSALLNDKTFSLNGYCDTLYDQKRFEDASDCYDQLADNIEDKKILGMISYRQEMSRLHYSKPEKMITSFARLEDAYPGADAGFRSAIKKADLKLQTQKGWESQAYLYYNALALKSVARSPREEAAFKEALILHLMKDDEKCAEVLMSFLRNFRQGKLRRTAEALLISILPELIKNLIVEEKYIDALVLAKKNKIFFKKNWIDVKLLADMAAAYHQLGIYREATRLYTYLMDIVSEDEKEAYFLPLMTVAYDGGNFRMVEDYADQFSFRYPGSNLYTQVLYLRILSLVAQDLNGQALELLPDQIPENIDFRLLAARLYFNNNQYEKTKQVLVSIPDKIDEQDNNYRFMLAESSFFLEDYPTSDENFDLIRADKRYGNQARYRLAQIKHRTGHEEEALKLFTSITEENNSSLWRKLAIKEIALNRLEQDMISGR